MGPDGLFQSSYDLPAEESLRENQRLFYSKVFSKIFTKKLEFLFSRFHCGPQMDFSKVLMICLLRNPFGRTNDFLFQSIFKNYLQKNLEFLFPGFAVGPDGLFQSSYDLPAEESLRENQRLFYSKVFSKIFYKKKPGIFISQVLLWAQMDFSKVLMIYLLRNPFGRTNDFFIPKYFRKLFTKKPGIFISQVLLWAQMDFSKVPMIYLLRNPFGRTNDFFIPKYFRKFLQKKPGIFISQVLLWAQMDFSKVPMIYLLRNPFGRTNDLFIPKYFQKFFTK
ncbi:MAG: hypothetical protein M5T52_03710 [Ignavibacteriaceae bacterium]|nr:hypothetical protein [Ignavibacteriaceae bacterium]